MNDLGYVIVVSPVEESEKYKSTTFEVDGKGLLTVIAILRNAENPPPVDPPPENENLIVKMLYDMRVRDYPWGNVVGRVYKGNEVIVYEHSYGNMKDGLSSVWIRIGARQWICDSWGEDSYVVYDW